MSHATLEVDLSAITDNYRLLKNRHAKKSIASVVKANAYGLGITAVAKALSQAGCEEFFVATLEEGVELSGILPKASIAVFNGIFPGEEKEFAAHRLVAVINDVGQLHVASSKLQVILHVDTGMTRLGLTHSELQKNHSQLATRNVQLMSHLACANEPAHPKNAEQLVRFKEALAIFPGARASLCNSSGHFLPPEFHFDIGRPGCALYGINPVQGKNPMKPVAKLSAPILQIRTTDRAETVGYGATHEVKAGTRIAIAAIGYADGYFRMLSNKGFAYIGGHKVPAIGRVSMDMVALDVSNIPQEKLTADNRAEFINEQQTVDDIAAACGTIGYEIFTRIGRRVKRAYN